MSDSSAVITDYQDDYYKIELIVSGTTLAMLRWDNSHKVHCTCNHACRPVRQLIEKGEYVKVEEDAS